MFILHSLAIAEIMGTKPHIFRKDWIDSRKRDIDEAGSLGITVLELIKLRKDSLKKQSKGSSIMKVSQDGKNFEFSKMIDRLNEKIKG